MDLSFHNDHWDDFLLNEQSVFLKRRDSACKVLFSDCLKEIATVDNVLIYDSLEKIANVDKELPYDCLKEIETVQKDGETGFLYQKSFDGQI